MNQTKAPEDLLLEQRKERVDQVVARRTRSLTVVLEEVEDPHNLAAVLRTVEALGLQDMHIVESEKAPFFPSPKITQGAEKWLDIRKHRTVAECIEHLRSQGYGVWATSHRKGTRSLYDLSFDGKVALVFGNEVDGVTPRAISLADGTFWVPMRGMTPSVNISVAAGIALAHAVNLRRRARGEAGDLAPAETREVAERFYRLSVKQRSRIFRTDP